MLEHLPYIILSGGEVFVPDGSLSMKTVNDLFTKLTEKCYSTYKGLLKCGNLKCNITLYPAPEVHERYGQSVKQIWWVFDEKG